MAGDWIKMRVSLTTNPKVLRIAECLLEESDFMEWSSLTYGVSSYPPQRTDAIRAERYAALRVTRYVTVTALLRFWGYANEHAKGEFVAGVFPEDIDEVTGVPGFGKAIEAAGWVEFDPEGGMTMPNFGEHNTSADARSSGAERQAKYREKQKGERHSNGVTSDVTRDVTVTPREEKRREEEKQEIAAADAATPAKKSAAVELDTWLATLGDELPIPADDPIFAYAEKVGLPLEFLELSWHWFCESMRAKRKRQAGWRQTYRNAVQANWGRLWAIDREGQFFLTTEGKQAQRALA